MPRIYIETIIHAPIERTFDLARSLDFHVASMEGSDEKPVAGRTTGLIEAGEFVEWEATHLFVRQRLSSRITELKRPHYFVDEMVKGAFRSFKHRHEFFERSPGEVLMIDDFQFEAPLGLLGHMANFVFLRRYVKNMISSRNAAIKHVLENGGWEKFVKE